MTIRLQVFAATVFSLLLGFGRVHAAVSDPLAGTAITASRLPDMIDDQGVGTVAQQLTAYHRWAIVSDAIVQDTADVRPVLPSLLRAAPTAQQPALRAALRRRLVQAPVETIALLDPAHGAPFNGAAVCAVHDTAWRQRAVQAINSTHDVVHALQRIDCLRALGVANPS
ncbi:hypothetical protein [Tanticharoenia sakaeratensis]|uniref:Secreted protein n=1 Tax=Tanticharoenia sakaeratensis NBRC 103193 TaxID=1231623 RepID=A0A0D6MJ05_9PROT|nr:hypothetical protein [Tanticharoenia sakaeratensis]GAN53471.1 hypothetical protein Tasa_010_018 [Tanticharoenia sakaeratensis NBRC 103193]GBQ17773.1 hypothetical protein AA103193_0469 [Tanticharoenia sakaeratensis NBRC 103193]